MANKDGRVTQDLLLCQFLFASRSVGLLLVNITADSVRMLMRVCMTHILSGALREVAACLQMHVLIIFGSGE